MDKTVEAFKTLSAASVSDAIDRLGRHGMAQGIRGPTMGHHVAGFIGSTNILRGTVESAPAAA
jgi:hypothetical protein